MVEATMLGLSPARLARLDDVMKRRYVDSGELPGLMTMIYRAGELAHVGMSGQIDLERGTAMREDAIFRIYSMSKPITAVALMMLVEEGLIGLDDTVETYIPSWKTLGVYMTGVPTLVAGPPPSFITSRPQRPMKVIDLATHTAGLTYGFMMRTAVDAAYRKGKVCDLQTPGGLDEFIEQLSHLAAGILSGYGVELFRVHRRHGLSGAETVGSELRRVSAHPSVRTPRHDRHRLLVPAGKAGPLRLLLSAQSRAAACSFRTTGRRAPTPSPRAWSPAAAAWCRPGTTTCASAA